MQHYIQLIAILVCSIGFGNAQQICATPDQRQGHCVDLRRCASLLKLIKKPNLSIDDRNYLRNSQCAYNGYPWVCCPIESAPTTQPPVPVGGGLQASDLPAPGYCGNHLADRIVGGNETQISEYPWMALLEYTKPSGKGFHCGGVLINKDYVLTASHCVNGRDLAGLKWTLTGVRLGEWDQETNPDCEDGYCADPYVDVPVVERIPHENYQPTSKAQENDIALLRLERPVTFTNWIKPICLPISPNVRDHNHQDTTFTVAGWGKTENASSSAIKLKVELDDVPIDECNNVYKSQGVTLTPKQLCAGGKPKKDSCRGDSGGPLMAVDNSERLKSYFYLAGIVSFGPSPCGLPGWPGVYTRVDQYVDWILSRMRP